MTTPTYEEIRGAYVAYRREHGTAAVLSVISEFTPDDDDDHPTLESVADEDREKLLDILRAGVTVTEDGDEPEPAAVATGKSRTGPTLDQIRVRTFKKWAGIK